MNIWLGGRHIWLQTIILAAWFAATLTTAASSQSSPSTRIYDPSGRSIGTTTTHGNTTDVYDAGGRRTGSAVTNNGTTIFYDASGRRTGSESPTNPPLRPK